MRTLNTQQDILLNSNNYSVALKLEVEDFEGNFIDLTSLEGRDWVEKVSWDDDIDSKVSQAKIDLVRSEYLLNLSTFVEDSKLNIDSLSNYEPLLQLNRGVKIYTATIPQDMEPRDSQYELVFHGLIQQIDPASGDNIISITADDLGARLRDRYIEDPIDIGANSKITSDITAGDSSADIKGTTGFSAGNTIFISDGTNSEAQTIDTISSNTINITSTFNNSYTTDDETVISVSIPLEDAIQTILDDVFGAGEITLYTPTSPNWFVNAIKIKKKSVFEAIKELASQPGWKCRYKYDSGSDSFRLTLHEPDRSKTTPDFTFDDSDYFDISQFSIQKGNIRNVIRGVYGPNQENKNTEVVSGSSSITKYGRLFMEITEASSSAIDTQSEMQDFLNAILSDLSEPKANQGCNLPYFFATELGDLYRFKGNGEHYSADQDIAVVSYSHTIDENGAETSLTCRGKPAGFFTTWLEREAKPGIAPTFKPPEIPSNITVNLGLEEINQVVSAFAEIDWDVNNDEAAHYEIRYRKQGDEVWEKLTTQSLSIKISPLISNTTYEFQMRAVVIQGGENTINYFGDYSTIDTFTTPPDNQAPATPVVSNISPSVRGFNLYIDPNTELDLAGYEIHASTSSGFTPDSSTLQEKANRSRFEITGLPPGATYYVKVIAYDTSGNNSNASVEDIVVIGSEVVGSTLVVAASDSSPRGKAGADYACDGTSDQVEINNAIESISSGDGEVKLLEGTYYIDDNIVLRDSTSISGQGPGTEIKVADGVTTNFNMIQDSFSEDYFIKDLQLDGNKDNTSGDNDGLRIGVGGTTGDSVQNLKIINCYRGIFATGSVSIQNCFVSDCQESGIYVSNSSRTIVANNQIYNCPSGIRVGSSSDFSIFDNQCINNGDGIRLSSVSDGKVIGNVCSDNSLNGILLTVCVESEIKNNTCIDNSSDVVTGTAGISLGGDGVDGSDKNEIQFNKCKIGDISTGFPQDYGIYIGSNSEDNFVTNNNLTEGGDIANLRDDGINTRTTPGNWTSY